MVTERFPAAVNANTALRSWPDGREVDRRRQPGRGTPRRLDEDDVGAEVGQHPAP